MGGFSCNDALTQKMIDFVDGSTGIGLVSGDSVKPYGSITAAFVDATTDDVVILSPNTYNESFTVPAGVKLMSIYGKEVTIIAGDGVPTNDVITLSTGCAIEGLEIRLPTGTAYAINAGASVSASAANTRLAGQGGTGRGVVKTNVGALSLQAFTCVGDCDYYFEVKSGVIIVQNGNILSGTINKGFYVTGGRLTGTSIGLSSVGLNIGIELAGGEVDMNGLIITEATRAIHVTNDNATGRFISMRIADSVSDNILVDPGLDNARIEVSSSQMSYNKISYPTSNNNIHLYYLDTRENDEALQCEVEVAIGRVGHGRELVSGEGDSTTVGMIVFQNDNLEVGNWTDVTAGAASPSGSPVDSHPSNLAGSTTYIGGDFPFPGIKINVLTPLVPGPGSLINEIWNGSAWVPVTTMATQADYPYEQYGIRGIATAGSQQIRSGHTDGWTTKALNGETKYWSRTRIITDVTSVATIEQIKLHTNRFEVNRDGFTEYFGQSRVPRGLPVNKEITVPLFGSSPGSQNILVSSNITFVGSANKFANNSLDARGLILEIPPGLDTSFPLKIFVSWFTPATSGVGQWGIRYTKVAPGHVFDGSAADTLIEKLVAAPGVANTGVLTEFELDIQSYLVEDAIAIAVQKDATGGSSDTLGTFGVLQGVAAEGTFWKG